VGVSVVGAGVGYRVGATVGADVLTTLNDAELYAVLSLPSHPLPSGSKHVKTPAVMSYSSTVTLAVTSESVQYTYPVRVASVGLDGFW